METTQNNKLIAEFMGLKEIYTPLLNIYEISETEICLETDLAYHTDWNWLMKVVDKIESFQATIRLKSNYSHFQNQNYHQVTIEIDKGKLSESRKTFWDDGFIYKHHSNTGLNRIDCYYESVIEFIKWYNNKQ